MSFGARTCLTFERRMMVHASERINNPQSENNIPAWDDWRCLFGNLFKADMT